uniref:Putative secreted protein n=1 Tax=Ixodes ricinus TaxID=34613 RepID=A0A6B0U100_IXORI
MAVAKGLLHRLQTVRCLELVSNWCVYRRILPVIGRRNFGERRRSSFSTCVWFSFHRLWPQSRHLPDRH